MPAAAAGAPAGAAWSIVAWQNLSRPHVARQEERHRQGALLVLRACCRRTVAVVDDLRGAGGRPHPRPQRRPPRECQGEAPGGRGVFRPTGPACRPSRGRPGAGQGRSWGSRGGPQLGELGGGADRLRPAAGGQSGLRWASSGADAAEWAGPAAGPAGAVAPSSGHRHRQPHGGPPEASRSLPVLRPRHPRRHRRSPLASSPPTLAPGAAARSGRTTHPGRRRLARRRHPYPRKAGDAP